MNIMLKHDMAMQIPQINVSPLILLGFLCLFVSGGMALVQGNAFTNTVHKQSPESLKLIILPEKDIFESLESIKLIVINENDGLEDLNMSSVRPEYDYDVMIRDLRGRAIPLSEGEKLKNRSVFRREHIVLKPGEKMVEEINLNELFDLGGQGEYKVTISRSYSMKRLSTNGSYLRGKAISNQVIIKVREKGALATDQKQSQDNVATDGQDLKLIILPEKDIFNTRENLATNSDGRLAIDSIESVTIKVICKNDSPKDLILPIVDSEYDYDVALRDSHGEVIPLSNEVRQIKNKSVSRRRYTILKPGEEMIEEINLDHLFALSGTGEYQVVASRLFYQEKDHSADNDYALAKAISNQTTIRVYE